MTASAVVAVRPITCAVVRYRLAIGLATLLMLGLSGPLWSDDLSDFARVPFLNGLPNLSVLGRAESYDFLLIVTAVAAAGIGGRKSLGLSLGLLFVFVFKDQHRLQPWVYQYLLVGFALATLDLGRALAFARLFTVALYLHSGLSKLDVSFCGEMGLLLLQTATRPWGLHPDQWPVLPRLAIVLVMPLWEILVALGLCFRRTRPFALAGAVIQHLVLIGILGPWGLDHSAIVLVWNAALIIENLIAFQPSAFISESSVPNLWREVMAGILSGVVLILPFFEPWGLWDAWPSFALYASHNERTEVWFDEADLPLLPASIRRHVKTHDSAPWGRLDLTGWSREARGTPVYPQGRACNGLAEAFAARYRVQHPIRVVQWSRADRFHGQRTATVLEGFESTHRHGESYFLNAHPQPAGR